MYVVFKVYRPTRILVILKWNSCSRQEEESNTKPACDISWLLV